MSGIVRKTVLVFTAFRDGRETGIDLDRDALVREHKIRAGSSRACVKAADETVGVIEGHLHRWWFQPGNPGGTKLHWECPQCGLEQWGDWNPAVTNPCLWYSDCRCVGKWLISWSSEPDLPGGYSG